MASITCGNCKATHSSANQVRECYATHGNTKVGFKSTAPSARPAVMAKEDLRSPYEAKGTPYVARGIAHSAAPTRPAPVTVPDGRYAIHFDGTIKFFKVQKGKAGGKWERFTFVEEQASDFTYPVKNRDRRNLILAAIAKDVPAAMALYGVELGKCGHCGRILTSDWRKKGIGPVCAQKMGFVG